MIIQSLRKKSIYKILFFYFFTLFSLITRSEAAAWSQEKGKIFYALTDRVFIGDSPYIISKNQLPKLPKRFPKKLRTNLKKFVLNLPQHILVNQVNNFIEYGLGNGHNIGLDLSAELHRFTRKIYFPIYYKTGLFYKIAKKPTDFSSIAAKFELEHYKIYNRKFYSYNFSLAGGVNFQLFGRENFFEVEAKNKFFRIHTIYVTYGTKFKKGMSLIKLYKSPIHKKSEISLGGVIYFNKEKYLYADIFFNRNRDRISGFPAWQKGVSVGVWKNF